MSDVSGSMGGIPMEVSIALGLMISQVQSGIWANRLLTFSENPEWFEIPEGNLAQKISAIARMNWGGSTNMEAAFDLILNLAKENNIPKETMPKTFLILTDMCWNNAIGQY